MPLLPKTLYPAVEGKWFMQYGLLELLSLIHQRMGVLVMHVHAHVGYAWCSFNFSL